METWKVVMITVGVVLILGILGALMVGAPYHCGGRGCINQHPGGVVTSR